jgi:hypothetical protein
MATATDRRIIDKARQSARSLHVAATWVNSGLPLKVTDDFLYELFILFELIYDLTSHYLVEYFEGNGTKQHNFPRKPANKEGWPKFTVWHKDDHVLLWQICAGTKIADIHGKKRAPDITFQIATSSDTPNYQDLVLIWDAKYTMTSTTRIRPEDLSEFGRWLEIFGLRGATKPPIILSSLVLLVQNCLITSGNKSTEPDAECIRLDLREVYSFYPGKTFSVRP